MMFTYATVRSIFLDINWSQCLWHIAMNIVFCLPGRQFSDKFLTSWSRLLTDCLIRGHKVMISQGYSSVVHFARAKCLGGDVLAGRAQVPFQGKLEYDVIMWIDSDMVFMPQQFHMLLESPHPVTAGMYLMEDGKHFATVKEWDVEHFKQTGSFQFMTPQQLDGDGAQYEQVAYTGMGWMLIRKGVLEKVAYPWFYRAAEALSDDVVDMSSEDVALCKNMTDAGIPIHVDTRVRVGHQKTIVL